MNLLSHRLTYIVFIFVCIVVVYTVLLLDFYTPPKSGSIIAGNLSSYGFGTEKRVMIIDLTDIGSVNNIHRSDKKFAILTWGDKNGLQTSPIGIELKGDPRPKLNLAFEFWEPSDCTSIDTCDDDKVEMYDFGEKYEDYVLNGDYHEPTFIRDDLASKLTGGILKKTLVEVLFKIGDKYTYEGVYLLGPAIQRRFLEKTLGWDASGKKEDCDDSDYNPKKVAYILEYTTDLVNFKTKECPIFKNNIKMRYPKCDFYDEEEIKPCRDEYVAQTRLHVNSIVYPTKNTSNIDLESFSNTYIVEMLMRSDFPYGSQYFYVNPDTGKLYSGPRWDYDRPHWKSTKNSWDIIDRYGFIYHSKPAYIWKALGKNKLFIEKVKQMRTTIADNLAIASQVIYERKQQFQNGFFDREIERWKPFGRIKDLSYAFWSFGERLITEKTFEKELQYMQDYFEKRTDWMLTHLDSLTGFKLSYYSVISRSLLNLWPLWTSLIFTIVAIVYETRKCRKVQKKYKAGVKNKKLTGLQLFEPSSQYVF